MEEDPIKESSSEQLNQLERLLLSRFDLNSSPQPIPSTSVKKQSQLKPSNKKTDQNELLKSSQKVSFRLLSSHKSPQLINLRPSTPEIETEEEIVYPLQSLERQRIFDVADEPKELRRLIKKRIKSLAVDHLGLRTLAEQIPNQTGPPVRAYRIKKAARPLTHSMSQDPISPSLSKDVTPSTNTIITPSLPTSNLAKLSAVIPIMKPQPSSIRTKLQKPTLSNRTQKRKKRRARQAYRRQQVQLLNLETGIRPAKLVTMKYL